MFTQTSYNLTHSWLKMEKLQIAFTFCLKHLLSNLSAVFRLFCIKFCLFLPSWSVLTLSAWSDLDEEVKCNKGKVKISIIAFLCRFSLHSNHWAFVRGTLFHRRCEMFFVQVLSGPYWEITADVDRVSTSAFFL